MSVQAYGSETGWSVGEWAKTQDYPDAHLIHIIDGQVLALFNETGGVVKMFPEHRWFAVSPIQNKEITT